MPLSLQSDRVLGYIINSYAGLDEVPNMPNLLRRVWLWEEDEEVKMGNTEAFCIHLQHRFKGLSAEPSRVHSIMRQLGEYVQIHKQHSSPRDDSPKVGKYKQPDPDSWTVNRRRA